MLFSGSGDAAACLVSGAPFPPSPSRHQRQRCSTWVTVVSRAGSVWRLCILNLSSDAASSSTCLCWRRRTKNYCWETTETLKKLCLNRIFCIVAKGNCESADCRRSLNGGLRLKLLLGIYVWDQPLSPGLLPKIPSSIKGHEASIKKQHSK